MKQLRNSYKNKVTRFEIGTKNKGVDSKKNEKKSEPSSNTEKGKHNPQKASGLWEKIKSLIR